MTPLIRRLARSSAVHVFSAFLVMGGWALFANGIHPMPKPLVAALVQGAMSAGLTLYLKTTIETLARRFTGPSALWVPPLVACLGSPALLVTVHTLSGTPEILKTVAVPLLASTSYATAYNWAIRDRTGPRPPATADHDAMKEKTGP